MRATTTLRALTAALVVTALPVVVSACCCFGGGAEDRIAELEKSVKGLKAKKKRLEAQIASVDEVLKSPANAPLVVAALEPGVLEDAIKDALPLSFPADRLHNLVSGTVVITGWTNVKLKDGKVHFELRGKGKKLKINSVIPPGYEKMAKELIGGLESGLTLKVTGTVDAAPGDKLLFKGKVTDASLKKHNKDDYRAQIKSAVNDRFMKAPHAVKLSRVSAGGKSHAIKAALGIDGRLALVFAP